VLVEAANAEIWIDLANDDALGESTPKTDHNLRLVLDRIGVGDKAVGEEIKVLLRLFKAPELDAGRLKSSDIGINVL
jgi:hypothetical protein